MKRRVAAVGRWSLFRTFARSDVQRVVSLSATAFALPAAFLLLAVLPAAAQQGGKPQDGKARQEAGLALRWPGQLPGGAMLLPNGWSLRPVGRQIPLGDFPVNVVFHPSGRWAVVSHGGWGTHELVVVDLASRRVVSRAELRETYLGLAMDPQGRYVYASGGTQQFIYRFEFQDGYLVRRKDVPATRAKKNRFIPTGLALSADGKVLYSANAWGDTVSRIPLENPEQLQEWSLPGESYPYLVLPDREGKRLFVSLWGAGAVAVLDAQSGKQLATWKTDLHPTEMLLSPDGKVLFVACANSNSVHVIETQKGRTLEVISAALYPGAPQPTGTTPNSIALTPDGQVLFVANANNNTVAVFNVSRPGKSVSLGLIPTGWYPTCVRYHARRKTIYVANGKGLGSRANPLGPQPEREAPKTVREYIGKLFQGTLQEVRMPGPKQLAQYTQQARKASPLRKDLLPPTQPPVGNPIPAKVGEPSPIKHCIYIIKENRTYDQVFGDMPQGNGDPRLCLFPERVTPNHHALAREFVLLDNFYVNGEVSADGQEWSLAAYATDFIEKSWPLLYRGQARRVMNYLGDGNYPIAYPKHGYLWDHCHRHGVDFFIFGMWLETPARVGDPARPRFDVVKGHFDPLYRPWDMDYMDIDRAKRFAQVLKDWEAKGSMPQMVILQLPNDHTYGLRAGKRTPTAMVADNDQALGMIVEAVSRSRFWKETAIFVVEDDAQNGPDHVDAHRTVALVISPYTKRGYVDSTLYSTASMLRTMELILGMPPMSQFDAAATPMYNSFQPKPNLRPYKHRPAQVDLNARNPGGTLGAKISAELDFSRADAADDLVLNRLVWQSVRGPHSVMPAPVRASFLMVLPEDDDDEEGDEEEGDDD